MRPALKKIFIVFSTFIIFSITVYAAQEINTRRLENSRAFTPVFTDMPNGQLAANNDLTVEGQLRVSGEVFLDVSQIEETSATNGRVLSIDELGKVVLTKDIVGDSKEVVNNITQVIESSASSASDLPFVTKDAVVTLVGLGENNPNSKLHINTTHSEVVGLTIQAVTDQSVDLARFQDNNGKDVVRIGSNGKLILDNNADHQIEVRPSGNTGYLSSSGGAIFIENSTNIGTGLGIFSNAGADAEGNMINVKVDNPLYNQAAFYMNYDGISNAVEIVSNTNDSSSNALSITNFNTQDSALGVIGYETGRGTIKVTHIGTGSDSNASGLSIDLKGSGTAAQGIFVDSTETGGTTGDLLKLRNEGIQRFAIDYRGSVEIGGNGFNTSVTKYGNTAGDEFFVGTNGAFRVQRAATDSEAFRTQVNGDTQGRWLGTADGKLKFGDGASAQDVVLQRTGVGYFQLDSDIQIVSQATNNDVLTITASDGSRLGRFTETGGGHGWFEVDNSSGTAQILFRADGGDSYVLSGNFGIGVSSFDATADKVLTFGNGTAPAGSIANGVQLWAEDVASSSELRVRDEAGNVSTLSPHNFSIIPDGPSEDMAWAFYGERDNLAVNADITKALRLVEQLTGEKIIYQKNLDTGEYLGFEAQSRDLELSEEVNNVLDIAVAKAEFEKHVSWIDNIWKFITDVTFAAKARFEQSAEFLADATFRGHLSVSADTAGRVLVESGTKRYRVNFNKEYSQNPLVYVSSERDINFLVENITTQSFEVFIPETLSEDTYFKWFILESQDGVNFEILEKSE